MPIMFISIVVFVLVSVFNLLQDDYKDVCIHIYIYVAVSYNWATPKSSKSLVHFSI